MSLGNHDAAIGAAWVHAIAEVTRQLSQSTPAPRGLPFFGLDLEEHEPHVLDEFCRQGIFRKYERVLIVDCDLGGAARWCATRWGCRVIGTDRHAALARGAEGLSRRAGMRGATTFVTADARAVPLLPDGVTHVWLRGERPDADTALTLRNAYRALRPGGHLMADVVRRESLRQLRALADREGFIAIESQSIAAVSAPHVLLTALSRLEAFVARSHARVRPALRALVAARRAAAQAPAARTQLFAQRPS